MDGVEYFAADNQEENATAQAIAIMLAESAQDSESDYKAAYDATCECLPRWDALDYDYQTAYVGQCIIYEANALLKSIKDGRCKHSKTMDAFTAFGHILGR